MITLSNQSEIRDVSVDSRKLWIWKEGEIRKNIDPSWETTSLGFLDQLRFSIQNGL